MIPNANATHFRLKAAQRDLIAAAGGIERAAAIVSYGKSTVGRWSNVDSPELMPVDAVIRLEEECGRHDFTAAMAAVRGRKLADRPGEAGGTGDIMAGFSAVMSQVGALSRSAGEAFEDGRITPMEAKAMIDKPAAALIDAANELRRAAAEVCAKARDDDPPPEDW